MASVKAASCTSLWTPFGAPSLLPSASALMCRKVALVSLARGSTTLSTSSCTRRSPKGGLLNCALAELTKLAIKQLLRERVSSGTSSQPRPTGRTTEERRRCCTMQSLAEGCGVGLVAAGPWVCGLSRAGVGSMASAIWRASAMNPESNLGVLGESVPAGGSWLRRSSLPTGASGASSLCDGFLGWAGCWRGPVGLLGSCWPCEVAVAAREAGGAAAVPCLTGVCPEAADVLT
mmetsp:Transcript_22516/g.62460  ORF Transcript_22516/g.62460 Transcript_22516/m.62460 type:complete len:233 (+) Transcript_22516:947-1645(+)